MKNKKISLWLILMLLLAMQPAALAQTTLKVAAVDQNNKGLVLDLSVEIIEGKGRVLLSTVPFTGISAQQAEYTATKLAENITGKSLAGKDVIFTFKGTADKIDGESAGGAMAAAVIADIEGRKPRDDIIFSGTIDRQGKIGEVGGVLNKAFAAAGANASIMMVPKTQLKQVLYAERIEEDRGLLSKRATPIELDLQEYAKEHWGMQVIGIGAIQEAMAAYYSEKNTSKEKAEEHKLEKRELAPEEAGLINMARQRIKEAEESAAEMTIKQKNLTASERKEINKHLDSAKEKTGKAEKYLALGYGYPAANQAFQAEISANTAKGLIALWTGEKTEKEMEEEAGKELALLQPDRGYNPDTIAWLAGAQERYTWAEMLLLQVKGSNTTDEEKIRNLAVAGAWTGIARELLALAGDGNMTFSMDVAKTALARLKEAKKEADTASMLTEDLYGAELYIKASEKEIEKGWFVAAAYDAIYGEARAFASVQTTEPGLEGERAGWGLYYIENAQAAAANGDMLEARAFARASERIEGYNRQLALEERMKKPAKEATLTCGEGGKEETADSQKGDYLIMALLAVMLLVFGTLLKTKKDKPPHTKAKGR